MKKSLTILGATGSIGLNAPDLLARHPDRYEAFALTAHRYAGQLALLCARQDAQAKISHAAKSNIIDHMMNVSLRASGRALSRNT